uniref:CHCH domain-containing protein n=1 Tax=Setaria digitata TaxID=48799 RepID=A0A915Q6E4_9BILA
MLVISVVQTSWLICGKMFLALKEVLFWAPWKSSGAENDSDGKDVVHRITQEEYEKPIQDAYVESVARLSYEELDDKYNPGPTLPDGGVNFECHCVGHLVASPCGHEFREAIKCQKSAGSEKLDEGACAAEFMNFMKCVIRTGCFKSTHDLNDDEEGEEKDAELEDLHETDEVPNKTGNGA